MIQTVWQATVEETVCRKRRFWFALYLGFVAIGSLFFGMLLARGVGSNYIVGDWLINYSGGFVRRGLDGAIVLLIGHAARIPLNWVVFMIQSIVFLCFIFNVYRLTSDIRWNYVMAALLLSPAGVGFTLVESFGGFRKEILLFAALSYVICSLLFGHLKDWQLSALLTVLLVALILSHEALLVCAPYFVAAIAIQTRSLKRVLKIFCAPMICVGAALIAVLLHPGDLAIAQAICASIGSTWQPLGTQNNICSGSIAWLGLSLAQARHIFVPILREQHFVRWFGLLAIPTFAPPLVALILLYRRDCLHREVRITFWCSLIAMIGTLGLCYVGMDWGRWMHMQFICLLLLILMIDRRAPPHEAPRRHRPWSRYATSALVIYATVWTLPCIYPRLGEGYLDMARGLVHYLHHYNDPPASLRKNDRA